VIILICADGGLTGKGDEMYISGKGDRYVGWWFSDLGGPRLAGEKTHPGNIRQTGWFGEVNI